MIANSVRIIVFQKDEEIGIKEKLLELIPFDITEEKIELVEKKAQGFEEKEIKIYELLLVKERHVNSFIEHLIGRLSDEVKEVILRQAESRLDDECNFYLRFSKEKLIKENDFWITDQGNCFHIKINIAAFPKKKEKALEIVSTLFKI